MSHINLNSPLPAKCEKEKLKGEIAKLREKLEATERSYEATREAALEWKQRAEAAEARIKATEEQEPVAWMDADTGTVAKSYRNLADQERVVTLSPLYAKPIPPADVQELQQEFASIQELHDIERTAFKERIAELERKLVEQQTLLSTINESSKLYPEHEGRYFGRFGTEELTALLAAEYQRGRADERAEAEKEEPVAYVTRVVFEQRDRVLGCEVSFANLGWLNQVPLYTRPLAQKPLSEELLRFLHGMDNIDGVWFGDIHPAEQGVFWWRKYLPTVASGITEKKEG